MATELDNNSVASAENTTAAATAAAAAVVVNNATSTKQDEERKKKLAIMSTTVMTPGQSRVQPSVCFRPTAQATSSSPAMMRWSHGMVLKHEYVAMTLWSELFSRQVMHLACGAAIFSNT